MKKWIWLVFFVPLVFYLPNLDKYVFPIFSKYSDLLISHWPNANFVHNSIFIYKEFPLWSDAILGGYPFFANPLAGLWYFPNWLTFLFPNPISFNLLFLTHIFLGALAIFLILRDENIGPEIAVLAGLMYELMPKIWAHYGQGHVSLIYAVCLTPWLLLITRRAVLGRKGNTYRYFPGIIFGTIILADPRWVIYALLAWFLYIISIWGQYREYIKLRSKQLFIYIISQIFVGFLLAAILLIPLVEYTLLTTRSIMTLADNLAFSLPISKILYVIFPFIGESAEWVFYFGGLGMVSVILAIINKQIRKRSIYWLILFALGIFISISSSVPVVSRIWEIPGLDLIRVPSRALFLCGISICFITAYTIDAIYAYNFQKKVTNLTLAGIFGFGILFLSFGFINSSKLITGIQIGSLSLILVSGILFLLVNRSASNLSWTWFFIAVLILDFASINIRSLKFLGEQEVFSKGQTLLDVIKSEEKESYRVFSPSDSISQHLASRENIEMVNGIDPLQLQSLHAFMKFMTKTGVHLDGYSVTFPPYLTGSPETDNKNLQLELEKLGLLNVRYLVSAFPLEFNGLNLLYRSEEGFVYENTFWLPRAWIQNPESSLGKDIIEIPQVSATNNSIKMDTQENGLLVLSEVMYPGWEGEIDGNPFDINVKNGFLRSTIIPEGDHHIIFYFQPRSLFLGVCISVLAIILVIAWIVSEKRIKHD